MIDSEVTIYEPIDKEEVKALIFEVRGFRVMKDIAVYFGTTTGNLNRAMKRNIKRFPENFCFQLTGDECSRFQIGILNGSRGSNIKYLPFVYTEQGVAMLTSALHTDRAIEASIQIMEAFVEMSHYIRQNSQLLPYDELKAIEVKHYQLADKVQNIEDNMLTRSDLSDLMKLFNTGLNSEEILILNGEPFKADIAYQKIYKKAKKNIIIVDNYLIEYPGMQISFVRSMNKAHDRFIILDYGTKAMKVYLCGSSSKDSGNKVTAIVELKEVSIYKDMVNNLMMNQPFVLR